MVRITYRELLITLQDILIMHGFIKSDAQICAEIFTENTLVGVASHGINRFPLFIKLVRSGKTDPVAKPMLINAFNAFEQWDGNFGSGPNNALFLTGRAIELAAEYGIGCAALRNTNHWLRPGYYAWHAADRGYILICWTNTIPNMPPWGGKTVTTGNNPLVLGVPGRDGHIVLDMALSQFSYGTLANYKREGKELPMAGGYDKKGLLSRNAGEIYETRRLLPIGYWKGSGLSLLLDLIAAILSGGKSTFELRKEEIDSGMSQMFIAIDPQRSSSAEFIETTVAETLNYYRSAENAGPDTILYPGERIKKTKKQNLADGIQIDESIWQQVVELKEPLGSTD